MRFDWDEAKATANFVKHGVSFNEAATIFGDVLSWTFPDPDHSRLEERWITIGVSEAGRILVVSHTEEGEETIRLISARRAAKKERKYYEKR